MTVIHRCLVSVLCSMLAASLIFPRWPLQVGGQNSTSIPAGGYTKEGDAIRLFLDQALPNNNFSANATCGWNQDFVKCNPTYHVVEVHLKNFGLNGTIPSGSLANLTNLEVLDLSNNYLYGPLPGDFDQLWNLTTLNLSRNYITGGDSSFVRVLGNSSGLRNLDFSYNKMSGPLPVDLNKLKLSTLRLNGNSFTGLLSGISFPENLEELDLSTNSLSGSIPVSLFSGLASLVRLRLANNQLSGTMSTVQLRPPLQELDLHNNSLSGEIPLPITSLEVVDLRENQFEGNVSQFIETWREAGSSAKLLDLSSNHLGSQGFPEDFSYFSSLETLGLADNSFFVHSFPVLPQSLVFLNLSGTNLSGTIPSSISTLVKCITLDLSHNDLSFSIPDEMSNLTALERLDLSWNNLSGSIPADLNRLTFLSFFNVSFNHLNGSIPSGNQFATFSNASYQNNSGLCGFPEGVCGPSSSDGATEARKSRPSTGAILAGLFSGLAFVLIVFATLFVWCRVSRAVKPLVKEETRHVSGPMLFEKDAETWATGVKDPSSISVVMFEKPLLSLSFSDLLRATANFGKEMQIADGGYGPVYKGVLADGTQLAIKVLVEVGFSDEKDAVTRIEGLSKVRHPNLVTHLGYCLVGQDSLLIYDYMVNGDLQQWLHELPEGNRNPEDWSRDTWESSEGGEISGDHLSWPTRHKVALGTARALAFLHHGCSPSIIHRDVKSTNVLLDDVFNAHLVDSGLAGISRMNGTPIVGGTLGYVPPEYGQTWQATSRGDVYSFGVVLLELVTGRKPTGHYFHDSYGGNLVGWVRSLVKQDKRGQKALDPKLVSRGYVAEMLESLRIGYLCTSETPSKRPTMQQVVGLLKDCQPGLPS